MQTSLQCLSLLAASYTIWYHSIYVICPKFSRLTFYLFIYLTEGRERERVSTQQAEGEGEAGSQLSREPDVGFDPRTLGSQPELKGDT